MNSNNPIVSSVIKDYKDSQKDFLPRFVSIPLSQEAGSNYKPLVKFEILFTKVMLLQKQNLLLVKKHIFIPQFQEQ